MTLFTIRIELRNATQKDQVRMHRRLRNLGIADVTSTNRLLKYKRLTDPYADTGEVTQYPSLQTAIGCAAECVGSYAMLVTEAEERQRDRLPRAAWQESTVELLADASLAAGAPVRASWAPGWRRGSGPRNPSLDDREHQAQRSGALPAKPSYDFSEHMSQPMGVRHLIGALVVVLAVGVAAFAAS